MYHEVSRWHASPHGQGRLTFSFVLMQGTPEGQAARSNTPQEPCTPPPQSLLLSAQKAAINPILIRRKSTGAQTPQNRLLTLSQPFLIGRNDVRERRGIRWW